MGRRISDGLWRIKPIELLISLLFRFPYGFRSKQDALFTPQRPMSCGYFRKFVTPLRESENVAGIIVFYNEKHSEDFKHRLQ